MRLSCQHPCQYAYRLISTAIHQQKIAGIHLDDSLKELQIRAFDAKSGEGEAAEAFQTLGVSATDAAGRIREPLELLDEVADNLLQLPTKSDRLWVADAVFGDEGASWKTTLACGDGASVQGKRTQKTYTKGTPLKTVRELLLFAPF
jgi:hypothetical protein